MVPEAEYRKVEEHEPVHPRLWAEMSPPPTRFNRRNAELCRRICSRRHPNASVDVRRLAWAEGRTQPNLRQRHRLAASKGKDCDRQPHRCAGSPTYERMSGMARELTLMSVMLAELP